MNDNQVPNTVLEAAIQALYDKWIGGHTFEDPVTEAFMLKFYNYKMRQDKEQAHVLTGEVFLEDK